MHQQKSKFWLLIGLLSLVLIWQPATAQEGGFQLTILHNDESYATIDNPDVIEVGQKLCIPAAE